MTHRDRNIYPNTPIDESMCLNCNHGIVAEEINFTWSCLYYIDDRFNWISVKDHSGILYSSLTKLGFLPVCMERQMGLTLSRRHDKLVRYINMFDTDASAVYFSWLWPLVWQNSLVWKLIKGFPGPQVTFRLELME